MADSSNKLNSNNLSTPVISNNENKEFIFRLDKEIICPSIMMLLGFGMFSIFIYVLYSKIAWLISIIIFIILILISIYFRKAKIKIVKDESNNKLYINHINKYCCVYKKYTYCLENIHFDLFEFKREDEDGNFAGYGFNLLFINDFKNPEEIDLNKSTINTIPAKIFYYFGNEIINKEDKIVLKNNLNNWINSPVDYNNPLNPIMNEHLYINKKNINIFIKLSEYFSIFYIKNPFTKNTNDCMFFLYFFLPSLLAFSIAGFGFYYKFGDDTGLIVCFISISLFFIVLFVAFLIIKIKNNAIIRIDCIYSKDFENMFIGLVKRNEKSYKNTFKLKMSNIKEFILENKDNDLKKTVLKIVFNNGSIQDIYQLDDTYINELNGLIEHLNKRLNKDNTNSMQNEALYPNTTPYGNI